MQESGSVIERFIVEYQVFKNGSWTQTIDYAIRVQSEDAKTNASVFTIDYNSFTDQVEILEAYTLNGKTKIKVEPSAIEDRDKGESKDYDLMKTRSVVFPQVQIGSRLFVKYRVKTAKPTILERFSTEMGITPSYFIEKFHVVLKSEIPLSFEVRDPRKLITVKQYSPLHIEVKNRTVLPGWVHAEKDPFFHPVNNTEFRVSSHSSWTEFFTSLNEDYEKIVSAGVPEKLRPWVEQAKKKPTNVERIQFLLEKMSLEFRYFGDWRRHNGGLVPRTLAEIEKSRYGDCKDLSSLLTSMLRALGMKSNVALVRRGDNPWGDEPDYKLPGVSRFNHAIVHVQDGEESFWLDPTNPVMSLKPYPDISGRPSWLMGEGGQRFVRLPAAAPSDFEHVHEYEYRFRGEDMVSVRVNAQLNKLAPYDLANELMMMPRPQVLSDSLDYFSEGQEVKSFKYNKEPQTGRLLKDMHLDLEYEAGRVSFTAGKSAFFVIPDGFLQGSFYETEGRESDLMLGGEPYTFKGLRRLKNTKLAQDPPETCRAESKWMKLEREVRVEGDDVVIAQNIELTRPYITRAEFRTEDFKKLQADAKRCFYRSGILIEPLQKLSKNAN
jgi:hypothetical protein